MAINTNTLEFAGIDYRTIDKDLQEDAFRVRFDGKENSGFKFMSVPGKGREFEKLASEFSSISLTVKVDGTINDPVWLVVKCLADPDSNSCYKAYNISDKLGSLPRGVWQQVSLSLSCFDQYSDSSETDNSKALFGLNSSGKLDLSISSIKFHQTKTASVSDCVSEISDNAVSFSVPIQ